MRDVIHKRMTYMLRMHNHLNVYAYNVSFGFLLFPDTSSRCLFEEICQNCI